MLSVLQGTENPPQWRKNTKFLLFLLPKPRCFRVQFLISSENLLDIVFRMRGYSLFFEENLALYISVFILSSIQMHENEKRRLIIALTEPILYTWLDKFDRTVCQCSSAYQQFLSQNHSSGSSAASLSAYPLKIEVTEKKSKKESKKKSKDTENSVPVKARKQHSANKQEPSAKVGKSLASTVSVESINVEPIRRGERNRRVPRRALSEDVLLGDAALDELDNSLKMPLKSPVVAAVRPSKKIQSAPPVMLFICLMY